MKCFKGSALLLLLTSLAIAQSPAISDGGVVNSATRSPDQPLAPGSLVSIVGTGLAADIAQADSVPLSTSIANVSVTFNKVPAPVQFVSDTQINVQVPWNTLPAGVLSGTVDVVVTRDGVASTPKQVAIGPFSPGIYAMSNLAMAFNTDGSLAQPAGALFGITGPILGIKSHPAKQGDSIIILGTGLGALDSEIPNGANSTDKARNVVTPPVVLINGAQATVASAILSTNLVGIYQVTAAVPAAAGAGNALPLQWQVGGLTSPDSTTMAVAAP